ncbi:MAG: hypothetical protein IK015_04520 [Treponema sp.]|nr:hypothetical protein [Treponema sp.]
MSKKFQEFDSAIANKSEAAFFVEATKISRKYAQYYGRKMTMDWELIADEAVLQTLDLCKKSKWAKPPEFYFTCLKNKCKWLCLSYMSQHKNEVSLEQTMTNSDGECFSDNINLKPLRRERTYNEEIELKAVDKIMELADNWEPREEIEKKLGIEHKLFSRLTSKYRIQFYNGALRHFLDCMRVYNFFKSAGESISLTRQNFKGQKLPYSIKSCISMAERYINLFQRKKDVFMKRFVLPPNHSSVFEKIAF